MTKTPTHNGTENVQPESDLPPGLSNPARRALAEAGYSQLEQLAKVSEPDIARLHGIGPNALHKLRSALSAKGLSFAGDEQHQEKAPATVDDFVQSKVLPQHRDIVQLIRHYMRDLAPDAQEVFSYGMPCYKRSQILAYVTSAKTGITFGFPRGKQFEDKYALLRGTGKTSRHLKFKTVGDASKEKIAYYIRQAVDWDAR
jgi:hypothetical protein